MTASCDTCRAPGSCCSGFVLSVGPLPRTIWREAAQDLMDKHDLPFRPARISLNHDHGPHLVGVMFDCPRLGADGRCTDYANRPQTCAAFEPGSDHLCCEKPRTLKGIPIHTIHAAR